MKQKQNKKVLFVLGSEYSNLLFKDAELSLNNLLQLVQKIKRSQDENLNLISRQNKNIAMSCGALSWFITDNRSANIHT